jgi:glycosyltransferase involved in cell wall biosynthesis
MKIGMIAGEYPPMPGGVGAFSRILAETMQAHGHDVHILSRHGTDSDTLPISTIRTWGFNSIIPIQEWVHKHQFDVINLQFQTAAYDMSPFVHFLPQIIHTPIVTTFHDLRFPYLFPKAGKLRNWIVMHLARKSAGVISTNHEDAQQLNHFPNHKLIPIGSNILSDIPSDYDRTTWRNKVGADDDSFLLGHFGFIKDIKGIDYLLDAMAKLCDKQVPIKLVFIGGRSNTIDAGSDDTYLTHLDNRIHQLGLDKHIHWTGYVEEAEVASYLKAVDLVTLPFLDGASYRRGSLMAAIQYGCAILTTQPQVKIPTFRHSENVWLVPTHSTSQIEAGILHLLEHPHHIEELREGALTLRQNFDWEVIAIDTISFFEKVTE